MTHGDAQAPMLDHRGRKPGAVPSLTLLVLINLFNYIDRYILAAMVPLIQADLFRGANEDHASARMGLLNSAFLISYMVCAPVFGFLADRMSRWLLIGLGVLVWSLASGSCGLALTYEVLLILRICIGIGEAAYGPAAPTLIADMFPVERRGKVMSYFYIAMPVGSALGYVLGGGIPSLATSMGLANADGSAWHWAFFVTLPPGIALAVWCFLRKDPPRGAADGVSERRAFSVKDYRVLLRTPSYVLCSLGMTAMTFALGAIAFWMPTYVAVERMGLDPKTEAGKASMGTSSMIFGGIVVVMGLVATIAGGLLADRLRGRVRGSYFMVSGAGMLIGVPFFVGALYAPFPYAWGLIALAVFFLFLNTGPSNTVLANVTHPSIRASAFAINIFVIHALGDAVSPWIVGAMRDASATKSFHVAFLVISAMMVAAGVVWMIGAKHLERDTEAATRSL